MGKVRELVLGMVTKREMRKRMMRIRICSASHVEKGENKMKKVRKEQE